MDMETVIVAILSFAGTMVGAFAANRKTTAIISYRIDELEKKVNKHNNLIDRTYKLEQEILVLETKLKNIESEVNK